jgi:hypothetical protein
MVMSALSPITVIVIAWIGFALLYVAYYKLFHPLARYPGPFWASLTNAWSLSLSVAGDWPERMDVLHARYGPILRIAPNEVAIDDSKAIEDICECTTIFFKGYTGYGVLIFGCISRWLGKGF